MSTSRSQSWSRDGARNARRRSPRAPSTRNERRRVRQRTATARYAGGVKPKTLDHVAFWVTDREPIVDFLTEHVGMHVIDRQDAFTLVGSDARRGKLTLFTADGPRERGALEHVALRVNDLERALAELPEGFEVERRREGEAYFELEEG